MYEYIQVLLICYHALFQVQILLLAFVMLVAIIVKIIASTEAKIYKEKKMYLSSKDAMLWSIRMLFQEGFLFLSKN